LKIASADRIAVPQRGARHAGDVSAHDHFHREGLRFGHDHRVGIRHRDLVVGDHIIRLIEPPRRKLIQHLAFVGHACQNPIECRQPIGGDKQPVAVLQLIPLTHLACLLAGQGQVRFT
jgi:hypothetical protein